MYCEIIWMLAVVSMIIVDIISKKIIYVMQCHTASGIQLNLHIAYNIIFVS